MITSLPHLLARNLYESKTTFLEENEIIYKDIGGGEGGEGGRGSVNPKRSPQLTTRTALIQKNYIKLKSIRSPTKEAIKMH